MTQLLLEDVSGQPFAQLAQALVFEPLHMLRANFENPLSPARGNIAKAHDAAGAPAAAAPGWQSVPELAASGVWVSARDLGLLTAALIRSYRGKSRFLSRRTAEEMMTEVARSGRGLGPGPEGAGPTRIFHHGGANDSYRAWIEGNLVSGDGIVILTNGGHLGREIRNAAADAFGWAINPPVRTVALDCSDARYHDYAGDYQLDGEILRHQGIAPPDQPKRLRITRDAATQRMQLGDEDSSPLLALSTHRFVAPDLPAQALSRQLEFHRNARGAVDAVTVDVGSARFYYVKQAAPPG